MSALEDMLRDALAERAAQSPIDPGAWDKTVARSRRRGVWRPRPRRWPTWSGWLVPAIAALATIAILAGAVGLGGLLRRHPPPVRQPVTGTAPAASRIAVSRGARLPEQDRYLLTEIPAVTEVIRFTAYADGARTSVYVWFGYVPGNADAGLAVCDAVQGGPYDGFASCRPGSLSASPARLALRDGSYWFRIGVSEPRISSVTAQPAGGRPTAGAVTPVRGLTYDLWAVSYPVQAAGTVRFADAAGQPVAHLDLPGPQNFPHTPAHGGITLFRSAQGPVVMYRLRDGSIMSVTGNYASAAWTGQPVSPPQAGQFTEPSSTSKEIWYGWARADAAQVTIRFGDGMQYSGHTVPGWPHSGLSLWGPITVQSPAGSIRSAFDTVVITSDASGQVLQRTPLIFLGPGY